MELVLASTQIWFGLMAIAISIFWVGPQVVEQMKRQNDLREGKLRKDDDC